MKPVHWTVVFLGGMAAWGIGSALADWSPALTGFLAAVRMVRFLREAEYETTPVEDTPENP